MMKTSLLTGTLGVATLLAAAFAAVPAPAQPAPVSAAAAALPKAGDMLRDRDGRKVGKVQDVVPDTSSLTVIADMKMYHVPLSSVSVDGKVVKTSLSMSEIRAH